MNRTFIPLIEFFEKRTASKKKRGEMLDGHIRWKESHVEAE